MEIHENELINRLKKFEGRDETIIRGIGDDGAVVSMAQGNYVFVQDTVVEHVHFEFGLADAYDVGKKALYVNISDVLSMGAIPLYFLVTLGIPTHITYRDVRMAYRGMMNAAREFHVSLLGGDTSEAKSDFFIDVSMVGRLVTDKYLGRDGAKEGDLIGVTGYLGESAYGLFLLKESLTKNRTNRFIRRYRSPKPPYLTWKALMDQGIPSGMMDISDGLIIDLERMMKESKKSALVNFENLPIPRELIRQKKQSLALSGGEDYQFLFSFPQSALPEVQSLQEKGLPVSVIGRVARGRGVKLLHKGSVMALTTKGYEHFGDNR